MRRFTEEEDAFILRNAGVKSGASMARTLGRNKDSVNKRIRQMRGKGQWKSLNRYGTSWTPEEDYDLLTYAKHYPIPEVAKMLHRTYWGCMGRLRVLGRTKVREIQKDALIGHYTAREAAQALGFNCQNVVSRWRRKGLIQGKPFGQNGGVHIYPEGELYRFIRENPDLVFPHLMEQPFRSYAEKCLERFASEYISPHQMARLKGIGKTTVHRAIREGRLPARRLPGHSRNYYIKKSDAAAYVPQQNPGQKKRRAA